MAFPLRKPRAPDKQLSYDEKRMELTEHLGELRIRILWCLLFMVLGSVIAYHYFSPLYNVLYQPLAREMQRQNAVRARVTLPPDATLPDPNSISQPPTREQLQQVIRVLYWMQTHPAPMQSGSIAFRGFHEPFLVRLKISIVYGLILALPFLVWQLALFVMPALTPQERRPLRFLAPVSVFLLAAGVTVAYITMFYAIHWFLSYLADFPQPAILIQDPNDYVMFFVKMIAAFALAFQLPVVLMGGAFIGLISSRGLIKHWRWGILIAALGALFTPSNDLFSMVLMAVPLLLLYFGSIALVMVVERMKKRPTG